MGGRRRRSGRFGSAGPWWTTVEAGVDGPGGSDRLDRAWTTVGGRRRRPGRFGSAGPCEDDRGRPASTARAVRIGWTVRGRPWEAGVDGPGGSDRLDRAWTTVGGRRRRSGRFGSAGPCVDDRGRPASTARAVRIGWTVRGRPWEAGVDDPVVSDQLDRSTRSTRAISWSADQLRTVLSIDQNPRGQSRSSIRYSIAGA